MCPRVVGLLLATSGEQGVPALAVDFTGLLVALQIHQVFERAVGVGPLRIGPQILLRLDHGIDVIPHNLLANVGIGLQGGRAGKVAGGCLGFPLVLGDEELIVVGPIEPHHHVG